MNDNIRLVETFLPVEHKLAIDITDMFSEV